MSKQISFAKLMFALGTEKLFTVAEISKSRECRFDISLDYRERNRYFRPAQADAFSETRVRDPEN